MTRQSRRSSSRLALAGLALALLAVPALQLAAPTTAYASDDDKSGDHSGESTRPDGFEQVGLSGHSVYSPVWLDMVCSGSELILASAVSSLKCNTGLQTHDFASEYLGGGFKAETFTRAVV